MESGEQANPFAVGQDVCTVCGGKTFVLFDGQPWCREHFLGRVDRDVAADNDAENQNS